MMSNKPVFFHTFLLIGFGMFFLSSCELEKRVFLSGYHIQWNHSKPNQGTTTPTESDYDFPDEKLLSASIGETYKTIMTQIENDDIDISGFENIFFQNYKNSSSVSYYSVPDSIENCDTIFDKNEGIILAIVSEITPLEIKYKKCENENGPTYTIGKADVAKIIYQNGTRDIFNTINPASKPTTTKIPARKEEGFGLVGFLTGMVGLLVAGIPLGIVSILFGVLSMNRISAQPQKYRGRVLGIISIILGAVDVVGAIITLGWILL